MAPIYLADDNRDQVILVHQNSALYVQGSNDYGRINIRLGGNTVESNDPNTPPNARQSLLSEVREQKLRVTRGWQTLGTWRLQVIGDEPPVVTFAGTPYATQRASLAIPYSVADDFGIKDVLLTVVHKASGTELAMPLTIPANHPKEGHYTAYQNLAHLPIAGQEVALQLSVKDDAGHVVSTPVMLARLPEKNFKPGGDQNNGGA